MQMPQQASGIAVALDHVSLAVGGKTILADVSFKIAEGEFVGVLGANGAGKTTLMRALLGLVPAASGSVTVLGRPVARGNSDIGYLPQTRSAGSSARLTGYDFLASSIRGERWGFPLLSKADEREIAHAVKSVGGEALVHRPLALLSGGERQRILLAQAILGNPRLLLLDEPLISLDPRQQQLVIELVRRLADERGLTVLFTAHELNQLLPVVDRVLYLGRGQAALGTVDEVVTPPIMSRLYGVPIEVVRVAGRIFVLSNGHDVEALPHGHHHHDHHDHHDQPAGEHA